MSDTKLLGINWNKRRDTYAVDVSSEVPTKVTQRAMLKKLASIYDPLGLLSPTLVDGKHLYQLAVDEKKGWDGEITEELKSKWVKWVCNCDGCEWQGCISPDCGSCDATKWNNKGASYFKVQNCEIRLNYAQARIGSMPDGSKFGCKCE